MEFSELLNNLYESEINVSVESFWDGGFLVRVGDHMNGYKIEKTFSRITAETVDWLDTEVRRMMPKSCYAGGEGYGAEREQEKLDTEIIKALFKLTPHERKILGHE